MSMLRFDIYIHTYINLFICTADNRPKKYNLFSVSDRFTFFPHVVIVVALLFSCTFYVCVCFGIILFLSAQLSSSVFFFPLFVVIVTFHRKPSLSSKEQAKQ